MTTRARSFLLLAALLAAAASLVGASTTTLRKPAHALPTRACDEGTTADDAAAYCDSTLPMEDRIADLLSRLAAGEKVRSECLTGVGEERSVGLGLHELL